MKKILVTMMLLISVSVVFAGFDNAIHSKKYNEMCIDAEGKPVDAKQCDPTRCGCLYHVIVDFVGDMF